MEWQINLKMISARSMKRLSCLSGIFEQWQFPFKRLKGELDPLLRPGMRFWERENISSHYQIYQCVLDHNLGIWKQDEQSFKTSENGPNPWQAATSAMCRTDAGRKVPGHHLPWRRDPCRIDWQVIICPQWSFKCTRAWWTVWFAHMDFHVWFLSTPLNNVITG